SMDANSQSVEGNPQSPGDLPSCVAPGAMFGGVVFDKQSGVRLGKLAQTPVETVQTQLPFNVVLGREGNYQQILERRLTRLRIPQPFQPDQPRDAEAVAGEIVDLFSLGDLSRQPIEDFVGPIFRRSAGAGIEKPRQLEPQPLVFFPGALAVGIEEEKQSVKRFVS